MTVFVNLGFHQQAVQTIKLVTMPYIIIIITIETAKVVSDIIFCPFFRDYDLHSDFITPFHMVIQGVEYNNLAKACQLVEYRFNLKFKNFAIYTV